VVAGNRITGNSPGLRASAGRFRLESNLLAGNSYGGLQLRGSGAEITGNFIHSNVGNGLFVDSSSVVLKNNSFRGNLLRPGKQRAHGPGRRRQFLGGEERRHPREDLRRRG
jgi:hypothetical protein